MAFPPIPVYPQGYDSDYTLYLVYNTTETKLAADNAPWAQEIEIVPVAEDAVEIWADNGFGNIDGELFYYDTVDKDDNGKVRRLKRCARQIGDERTKFNKRGSWVRSYVVAEHHNQLADCIFKTQDFIGRNFDERPKTLDWRIRNLRELDIIFDDYSCPDVNFTFNVVENDPVTGILAEYVIEVSPPGSVRNFRLDFGDGESTTSELEGQHRYAINARVDPVVVVSNDKCQIVQTPVERENPAEPAPVVTPGFDFPIVEVPDIPDFTFVPFEVPEPDIVIPPLATPCGIALEPGTIPSVILGPDFSIPSQVTIITTNPISLPSQVTVTGSIPSIIILDPPVPPTIVIDPPIPPTIVIVPPDSNITLDFDLSEMPRMEVDWGTPPPMAVEMTFARQARSPQKFAADPTLMSEFGTEFADLFDVADTMKVEYEPVGIPSEITVLVPDMKDIRVDYGDLFDRRIMIDSTAVSLPPEILLRLEKDLPNSIKLDASEAPEEIDLVYRGGSIPVDVRVAVETEHVIPDRIVVEIPKPIPNEIVLKHNLPTTITLEGPASIPLIVPDDVFVPLKFPDKMPEIELVYRGAPIEFKITMDEIVDKTSDGKNCFRLVPCTPS
jgi:hypothetical protein